MACMRGIITASMAEKEDFKNVARLSRAIAYVKQVHIPSHYETLMEYKEDVKVFTETLLGKCLVCGVSKERYVGFS